MNQAFHAQHVGLVGTGFGGRQDHRQVSAAQRVTDGGRRRIDVNVFIVGEQSPNSQSPSTVLPLKRTLPLSFVDFPELAGHPVHVAGGAIEEEAEYIKRCVPG